MPQSDLAKVVIKGCIPMHTTCAYGTCKPLFVTRATWMTCDLFSALASNYEQVLGGRRSGEFLAVRPKTRNFCRSMFGNGLSSHWKAICMPSCALATLLECLVPCCEHRFCRSRWYCTRTQILKLLKLFLRPEVVTVLAFVVLQLLQRTGHLFKGRILAKISADDSRYAADLIMKSLEQYEQSCRYGRCAQSQLRRSAFGMGFWDILGWQRYSAKHRRQWRRWHGDIHHLTVAHSSPLDCVASGDVHPAVGYSTMCIDEWQGIETV